MQRYTGILAVLALTSTILAACHEGAGTSAAAALSAATSSSDAAPPSPHVVSNDSLAAGRYLVILGQCNDCHTAGYAEAMGNIPESAWLTGNPVGYRGPWGTTYPANLRLRVQEISEDTFVELLHTRKALPPMPWQNVNKLSEADAQAIYRYIRSLGPKGEVMPTAVPPDQEPATPYVDMRPQHMERLAGARPPGFDEPTS